VALFASSWRVRDPFRELPASGDALEVIWGIEWYHHALFVRHASPLFDPLIFHPNGWHTATLAHTPPLFLVAQPFRLLGGAAFAYNALAIFSLVVAFWGSLCLFKLFNSSSAIVTVSAGVFTYLDFRWFRVGGHQHILWASSFLPWFLCLLERTRRVPVQVTSRRETIQCGLLWGVMINFALYGVFLGALAFAIWGRELFTWRRVKQAVRIAVVAFLVGGPLLILYSIGMRADRMVDFSSSELLRWSASLNAVAIPSLYHPIPALRQLARVAYRGPVDESASANLGITTFVLAFAGMWVVIRSQRNESRVILLAAIGMILAFGAFARWNGTVISLPVLKSLDQLLWRSGRFLKPNVFNLTGPPAEFETGIPLPGYLLSIFIPFWEAARVQSRYALLAFIALTILAGIALQRMRKAYQYVILAVWVVEMLPRHTERVILPAAAHPAHQWLAEQHLKPGEGILDISAVPVMIGSEIALGTLDHRLPTAGGIGSFLPRHTLALSDYFAENKDVISRPESAAVLRQYGIRYLLLHVRGETERDLWSKITGNRSMRPIQCFGGEDNPLWVYAMCVAEINPDLQFNLLTLSGWSGREDWGMWAIGKESQAEWYATRSQAYELSIRAIPVCVPNTPQDISIELNGRTVFSYAWRNCQPLNTIIALPGVHVRVGRNRFTFHYSHSARPENGDMRTLSVGFSELRIDSTAAQ